MHVNHSGVPTIASVAAMPSLREHCIVEGRIECSNGKVLGLKKGAGGSLPAILRS